MTKFWVLRDAFLLTAASLTEIKMIKLINISYVALTMCLFSHSNVLGTAYWVPGFCFATVPSCLFRCTHPKVLAVLQYTSPISQMFLKQSRDVSEHLASGRPLEDILMVNKNQIKLW